MLTVRKTGISSVLAEWGDVREAYDHPDAVAALAGVTPGCVPPSG
jgi:hypothetical protein